MTGTDSAEGPGPSLTGRGNSCRASGRNRAKVTVTSCTADIHCVLDMLEIAFFKGMKLKMP